MLKNYLFFWNSNLARYAIYLRIKTNTFSSVWQPTYRGGLAEMGLCLVLPNCHKKKKLPSLLIKYLPPPSWTMLEDTAWNQILRGSNRLWGQGRSCDVYQQWGWGEEKNLLLHLLFVSLSLAFTWPPLFSFHQWWWRNDCLVKKNCWKFSSSKVFLGDTLPCYPQPCLHCFFFKKDFIFKKYFTYLLLERREGREKERERNFNV